MLDEGFTEDDPMMGNVNYGFELDPQESSVREREELAFKLLSSLPRSRLATIQRRIAPLLQFDVVTSLPPEVALEIFSHLPAKTLLTCAAVSRRWRTLSDDQSLWKQLCNYQGWKWKHTARAPGFDGSAKTEPWVDTEDEGMGDSDSEESSDEPNNNAMVVDSAELAAAKAKITQMHAELDSSFLAAMSGNEPGSSRRPATRARHSAPSALPTVSSLKPNFKLLHQTHVRLQTRIAAGSYRLSALQTTTGTPTNGHTNTIYCLQLYTYPETGVQVLFTGSRDRTIREWNLKTGLVERVISGVHRGSVLSICVHNGLLASAGSDRRVAVWNLATNKSVRIICDHEDSVLCVRFDDTRLVSCSKDRTVRTYAFPDLDPQFVFGEHRAAVNAVSLSSSYIVSGSGDRSIRLWDANTGKLLRTFENHHSRGIASIDFRPPFVLSGSSDKHIRVFDMTSLNGWSTSLDYDYQATGSSVAPFVFRQDDNLDAVTASTATATTTTTVCQTCGTPNVNSTHTHVQPTGQAPEDAEARHKCMHGDLVRSVAFGDGFVLSGSYDQSVKVWDSKTGALVADLTGGHTARIFCIGFDSTKIVSCGEDQRIVLWDFSHGLDISFISV